jgi:argininosuccinate lyase
MTAAHCSRLAEDMILYGTSEFGFVKFGDGFSTGSSMMPQKRNPDVFELARGSGARVLGDLVSILGTIKGLPSGYSKDLQDDKRALFNAIDLLLLVLPSMAGAIAELRFEKTRMRAACSSAMMATDLADYLVKKGATFREAHGAVGALVRQAEEGGIELDQLPAEAFTAAHALFGADARDALGVDASLAARNIDGGTGPDAVQRQLAQARASLTPVDPSLSNERTLR